MVYNAMETRAVLPLAAMEIMVVMIVVIQKTLELFAVSTMYSLKILALTIKRLLNSELNLFIMSKKYKHK